MVLFYAKTLAGICNGKVRLVENAEFREAGKSETTITINERSETMKKRLVKTLHFENGKLYATTQGRRILLAECRPKVEIYEHETDIPVLGRQSYMVKKRHISIVICSDMEYTRDADENFLRTVSQFELSADIQRVDGVFENIIFDGLYPVEIDLDIDWIFETENQMLIRKLLEV